MRHLFERRAGLLALRGVLGAALVLLSPVTLGGAQPATTRVSVSSAGVAGNADSSSPSISTDGRVIAFLSAASNLVPNDTNLAVDVFVHDRLTHETTRVSVTSTGDEANATSWTTSIDAAGRYVAFTSYATNLISGGDKNGYQTDVFLHDRLNHSTTLLDVNSAAEQADCDAWEAKISADGLFITFDSCASNLVAGVSGWHSYIYDRVRGTLRVASITSAGVPVVGRGAMPSADGSAVVFVADEDNVVPDDDNRLPDLFVHDFSTHTTTRVSGGSMGSQANNYLYSRFAISGDGRYVVFDSEATNLVPHDTDRFVDVFIHDRLTRETRRVSVNKSGAQANGISFDPTISLDGRFIAFRSYAGNLITPYRAGDGDPHVYVVTLETGVVEAASVDEMGGAENCGSDSPSLSGMGEVVAFSSCSSDLVAGVANAPFDIYARERASSGPMPDTHSAVAGGGSGLVADGTPFAGDRAELRLAVDRRGGAVRGTFLLIYRTAAREPVARFEGRVECLQVVGQTAHLTGVITRGMLPDMPGYIAVGEAIAITVQDGGPHPHEDRFGVDMAFLPGPHTIAPCQAVAPVNPIDNGNFAVHV